MTLRTATRRAFLYPAATSAASVAWYLASGTIDAGDILEYGENISAQTFYSGTEVSYPFFVAIAFTGDTTYPTNFDLVETSTNVNVLLRFRHRTGDDWLLNNAGTQVTGGTVTNTAYVAFVIANADGSADLYINNSLTLSAGVDTPGLENTGWIGGNYTGGISKWVAGQIALDSTQRAALYATMSA